MSDYEISPGAREEIREIWDYIARDNEDAADRWILKLVEQFDLIARNPGIGHTREDLNDLEVLFWPVEKYIVIYRTIPDGNIEIAAVTQGSRNLPSYLRKRS